MSASEESAADFTAGGIAVCMENARSAMRGLASEGELGAGAIEFSAPFDELGDVLGSFFHQKRDGFRTAQAVAGRDGVLFVQADFVFIAERYSNAALRVGGCGFAEIGFRKDKNGARGAELDRGAEAGDAGTHYGVVGVIGLGDGAHRSVGSSKSW